MKSEVRKVKIKKLFNGYASVRSSVIQKAQKENKHLLIKLGNDEMLIQNNKLESGRMTTEKFFRSKWGDPPYYLVDFPWKPTKQLKLL